MPNGKFSIVTAIRDPDSNWPEDEVRFAPEGIGTSELAETWLEDLTTSPRKLGIGSVFASFNWQKDWRKKVVIK